MLWTIMPEDMIWEHYEDIKRCWEMPYGDCHIRVRSNLDGSCQIDSILSTNPRDFLKDELMPGKTIRY